MKWRIVILYCVFCFALLTSAVAEPKGPNGEKCNSSDTGVKHTINGKNYTCDKCVVLKCSGSGSQINNCTSTTYWTNCSPAAARTRPGGEIIKPSPSKQMKQ